VDLLITSATLLQDAARHIELSNETRVSLHTVFAVLGPIAVGASGGVAWLMRRFRIADEKREQGIQELKTALAAVTATLEAMRAEMRSLREESYETWCAHMMETYNLRLQLLNPKLKVPEIKAMEIIAQARAARAHQNGDEVQSAA